jgi:hypothetical protein
MLCQLGKWQEIGEIQMELSALVAQDRPTLMAGIRALPTDRLQAAFHSALAMKDLRLCAQIIKRNRKVHGVYPEQLSRAAQIIGDAIKIVLHERSSV